jgi:hypothetical protein
MLNDIAAARNINVSVFERGAASKGGCSQDWLPHVRW